MAVYKVETSAYPQQGHQMGFTPNNSLGRAQGSGSGDHNNNNGNMNMYVDMNNSLLHEHPHGGNLPLPPPLHLPVAAHPPSTNNTNSSGGAALTPTGHISTIGAAPTSQQAQEPLMLPDPRVLSDQALQDAYVRFLLEMETRGLQSMNINAAAALAPNQAPSPSVHYSAEVDNITRSASVAHRASSMLSVPSAPLPPHSSHGSQRPVPATAHTGLAAGVAGSNPADIRKHVKRSKSNGSEAAFPPSAMFPQSSASGAAAAASGVSSGSGRKTPNSPMLGRYNHSAYSAEGGVISYAQYLQQFGEPEEFELKDAFGQARHPGSPSYHSPYSPSHHLGSNAPAPSYYQAHGYLHSVPTQQQQAYGHTGGALGATPTSVAVGSANWSGANTGAYAATAHSFPTNPNLSSRAPSRCGGVQPPMAPDSRDELLELRPGLRTNCLSTLPSTYSQYMYANNNVAAHSSTNTNTGAGNNTTTSTPASMGQAIQNASDEASSASEQPRRIDLKTPKFVRSKFQGISAGLMGLSAALRFSSAEEEAEYTAATSAAAAIAASKSRTGAGASKSAAAHGAHAAGHGSTHTNRYVVMFI